MSALDAPHFTDTKAASRYLAAIRWPDGPICHYCGDVNRAYVLTYPGRYRCASPACRKDFTVKLGTLFEASHIPLDSWLLAVYLMGASKTEVTFQQLVRAVGVTKDTARLMIYRFREAMASTAMSPTGGSARPGEADKTRIGRKPASGRAAR